MRQPRARKSRKKSAGATNINARIPDDNVDAAPSDFDVGCVSCTLVFDDIYTVNLCGDHVWCINCAIDQFTAATEDVELFPVNCCGKRHILALQAVKYLLPSRVGQLYSIKLAEWTTERKVWCSNENCGQFLPKRWHRNIERTTRPRRERTLLHVGTVGQCKKCGDETCLSCSQHYADSNHVCKLTLALMIELPPYTKGCRSKQCPACKTPVELYEACNHMSCVCGYQYCFVCLLRWDGYHDCPERGDPLYDDNGRDTRGLHVRTGLDEGGYNRLGEHEYYPSRASASAQLISRSSGMMSNPLLDNLDGTAHEAGRRPFPHAGNALPMHPPPMHRPDQPGFEPFRRINRLPIARAVFPQILDPLPMLPGLRVQGAGRHRHHNREPQVEPSEPDRTITDDVDRAFDALLDTNGHVQHDHPVVDQLAEGPVYDWMAAWENEVLQDHVDRYDDPSIWNEVISDNLPSPENTEWLSAPSSRKKASLSGEDLGAKDAMISMFEYYEERFNQLNPFPSRTDTFNIEDLVSIPEELVTYRDRSLVTIPLLRPGHRTLAYESIDLGHMTWFEVLAMTPQELDMLNSDILRSWKAVHSRKYAYDPVFGFEAQGVDLFLEEVTKKYAEWEKRQGDRLLEETVMVRDKWVYGDE